MSQNAPGPPLCGPGIRFAFSRGVATQINDLAPFVAPRPGILRRPTVEPAEVRLSEVVSALSHALDITEGQPAGHAVRTCVIGMRLAEVLHLTLDERSALFYALLLKDLGCSSNAARLARIFQADDLLLKRAHKVTDWSRGADSALYAFRYARADRHVLARTVQALKVAFTEQGSGRAMTETRCERGADIARQLGLDPMTSEAIRALDEHWDGHGMPYGRAGDQIPLLGRICGLAQTVEVFFTAHGRDAAYAVARKRAGTWFDPGMVAALTAFEDDVAFWGTLGATDQLEFVADLEPRDRVLFADEARLDDVAEAFARVIDAKSPYTARHSAGVASIAVALGRDMGLPDGELVTLRRAALLHDIGKLGISNAILDKPGKLTPDEFAAMQRHTGYTLEILRRVRRFGAFAELAAAHHERLDGTGYHLGLTSRELPPLARILAVADVAEALTAERPYRPALPRDQVLGIMRPQVGTALCPVAFEALDGMDRIPT